MRSHNRPHSKRRRGNKVSHADAMKLATRYDETGCTIRELAAESGVSFVAAAEAVLLSKRHKNRLYGR